jgi:hypothetical protein
MAAGVSAAQVSAGHVAVARLRPMVENPAVLQPKERTEAVPLLARIHVGDIAAGEAEEFPFPDLRLFCLKALRDGKRPLSGRSRTYPITLVKPAEESASDDHASDSDQG